MWSGIFDFFNLPLPSSVTYPSLHLEEIVRIYRSVIPKVEIKNVWQTRELSSPFFKLNTLLPLRFLTGISLVLSFWVVLEQKVMHDMTYDLCVCKLPMLQKLVNRASLSSFVNFVVHLVCSYPCMVDLFSSRESTFQSSNFDTLFQNFLAFWQRFSSIHFDFIDV